MGWTPPDGIDVPLMGGQEARLVLTDVPYNVAIRGHVTSSEHREFAMASGEMSRAEFQVFNVAWMAAASSHLLNGGVLGTFNLTASLHQLRDQMPALRRW